MDRQDALLVRLICALALLAGCQPTVSAPRGDGALAERVLWAWDRPEDLRFIDPGTTSVAVFESIVTIDRAGRVQTRPRLHPLRVPEGTMLAGVVRIEAAPGGVEALGSLADAMARVAGEVLAYHRIERTDGLQVDFDARRSERAFYRSLLAALRADLPPDHALTITALASWCLGDPWIDDLPVDDAVPMLFRMGPDAEQVRAHLGAGHEFSTPLCRRSAGLSTDEPWPRLPAGRRFYLFHPRAWAADDLPSATAAR